MGLTFWSDRLFEIGEMTDGLYHCAMPLTDIENLSSTTIRTAFSGIDKMYGGGDGPEDVLLGNYLIFHYFKDAVKILFRYRFFENRRGTWMAIRLRQANPHIHRCSFPLLWRCYGQRFAWFCHSSST